MWLSDNAEKGDSFNPQFTITNRMTASARLVLQREAAGYLGVWYLEGADQLISVKMQLQIAYYPYTCYIK